MNILVGVISPAAIWVLPRHFVDGLRAAFPHHTFLEAWDRGTLRQRLPDADVAFTPFVDQDVFSSAKRLRWVQSPAAGVGKLMFPDLLASDVIVTTARGVRARSIAEHILGAAIALARALPVAVRAQARHEWAQDRLERSARILQGSRLGIVGLGAIGAALARIAVPFGFQVTAIRRRPNRPVPEGIEEVWMPDRLIDLLAISDVVVLSLPHTPETKQLIGRRELDIIKRGAILINVARGKLIDDQALVEALRDGRVAGAALDVFATEPLDASSPYWELPNVLITPHTAGAMPDYWTPLVALFSDNLRRFERGEPLMNVVDKTVGY